MCRLAQKGALTVLTEEEIEAAARAALSWPAGMAHSWRKTVVATELTRYLEMIRDGEASVEDG